MKKVLEILGLVFLIVIIAAAGVFGYIAYSQKKLTASSRQFIDESIPKIVTDWDKNELISRSSPQLLEKIESTDTVDKLFGNLKGFGSLKSISDAEGGATYFLSQKNKKATANYKITAEFEKGTAVISANLIQIGAEWKYLRFQVDGKYF
jgi:hypothetical protein